MPSDPTQMMKAAAFAHADLIREWVTILITKAWDRQLDTVDDLYAYTAAVIISEIVTAIAMETGQGVLAVWQHVSIQLLNEDARP